MGAMSVGGKCQRPSLWRNMLGSLGGGFVKRTKSLVIMKKARTACYDFVGDARDGSHGAAGFFREIGFVGGKGKLIIHNLQDSLFKQRGHFFYRDVGNGEEATKNRSQSLS